MAMIRALGADDAGAHVALRRQALFDAPLAFLASPEDDLAADVEAVRAQLRQAPEAVVLGALAPALAGVVGLYRDRHRKAAHKVHVWGMYVAPAHRRQGLAAALLAAALALAAILAVLALVHFFWAASDGAGLDGFVPTVAGRPLFTPGSLASALVGLALAGAALVAACRVGWLCLGLQAWAARLGIWAIAFLFAARAIGEFRYVGLFKRVRGSRFAHRDTWIFSPLCAVIAALATAVGLAP